MAFEIILAPEAQQDLRVLTARYRSEVRDGIVEHLRHEPTKTSRSRIKRLRGVERPQYRLRIGDVRIFFDVEDKAVLVLAIVRKAAAETWLGSHAVPTGTGAREVARKEGANS